MTIWRNLEPYILAQVLIRASKFWKAQFATVRRDRDGGLPRQAPPPRSAGGSSTVGSNDNV